MESTFFRGKRPAWTSVILIFIFIMISFAVVGPLVGGFLAASFLGMDATALREQLFSPSGQGEGFKTLIFIMQGCATLVGLILAPILYMKFFENKEISFFWHKTRFTNDVFLVGVIVILAIAPNSFFIEWNAALSLPDFLKGFETWVREREQQAITITTLLTTFDSLGDFLVALLVVAVLPSIGEELVFRGMLQPELHRATSNVHVAILVSAILFSAIHVQFFGFLPRMLLGVLFGYLYYWSGNLILPIFAHFINNGFAITMVYLHQLELVSFDIESSASTPLLPTALCTIAMGMLLLHFRSKGARLKSIHN